MKSSIMAVPIVMLSVCIGQAQTGGRVELYADAQMASCSLVDTEPGFVQIHIFHTDAGHVWAIQFAAPTPGCWIGATWLGDVIVTGMRIGDTHDADYGISVGYQECLETLIYIGYMYFTTSGMAPACCVYPVIPPTWPFGEIEVADCSGYKLYATGGELVINPDETCPCELPVPNRLSTWGRIKSLYGD